MTQIMNTAAPAPTSQPARQCAAGVCMVRPAAFAYNAETAVTNRLQVAGGQPAADAVAARAEFDAMVLTLRAAGAQVCVVEDRPNPPKPDAVFPNNWVSFHADGTVVLYPMLTPNRRIERRADLIDAVCRDLGFIERRRIDLTGHEAAGRFLEGTGSLVLDHRHRVAYACRSPRTDETLVHDWCRQLGYEALVFDAATPDGTPVYHTNVLLWIGEQVAGLGLDWVADRDRSRVHASLQASGREVLALPAAALSQFAGNLLELGTPHGHGDRALVMSASAAAALDPALWARLEATTDQLLVIPVPTIERLGGGSVRCMLAEVPT